MGRLVYLDDDNNIVGYLTLEHGRLTATGKAKLTLGLNVTEPGTLQVLHPHDGDRYLDAVRYLYRSPSLQAVWEDEALAAGVISKDQLRAQKANVSNNSPLHTLHKPADEDLVGYATGIVRSRWLREAGSLVEPREWLDELTTKDVDSIVTQVNGKWDIVYTACLPLLLDIVDQTVQRGMLHLPIDNPSVEHLKALGAEWLEAFAKTMMQRWVGERIRRVASAKILTLEQQSLAIVKAVEEVPEAFSIVMQPLVRRLLAFGAILQEMERNEPKVTVHKARETQQYVIITAMDERVCQVCKYISEIGPFWLKDALDLFDNYISAVEDGDLLNEVTASAWLSTADVEAGITRTELKRLGQIVPPFHTKCRCGIAFVQ